MKRWLDLNAEETGDTKNGLSNINVVIYNRLKSNTQKRPVKDGPH